MYPLNTEKHHFRISSAQVQLFRACFLGAPMGCSVSIDCGGGGDRKQSAPIVSSQVQLGMANGFPKLAQSEMVC